MIASRSNRDDGVRGMDSASPPLAAEEQAPHVIASPPITVGGSRPIALAHRETWLQRFNAKHEARCDKHRECKDAPQGWLEGVEHSKESAPNILPVHEAGGVEIVEGCRRSKK